MDIIQDINTYISIKHLDGSIPNEMHFMYAMTGFGKSLNMESLLEEYHRAGFTVLILSDVKDEFEFAYAMFPPEKYYHTSHLEKIGKPVMTRNVKLYHPFTFDIPYNQELPEIQFYGFSLKDLKRPEWSMIAESAFESDTIRLLLNASSTIGKNDGLYAFLHYVQDSVTGKKEKRQLRPDPKNFYLNTTSATAKSLQDISSYLFPFKKHYFLLDDNSPLKLDWKSILRNNKDYHFFVSYWIDDEKIKEFCIASVLNAIIRNKKYMTNPLLIVIPEIRYLVPFKPEGYKKFLAFGMKKNLSVMRNIGEGGIAGVFDSQVWTDVDENVRNSASFTAIGQLGGAGDIEKLSKALNYKRDLREQLKNMPGKGTYLIQGKEQFDTFTMWFPGHMHKEKEYSFFKMYKKYLDKRKDLEEEVKRIEEILPKEESNENIEALNKRRRECKLEIEKFEYLNMKNYRDLYSMMEKHIDAEENKFKEIIERKMKKEREEQEAIKKEREKNSSEAKKVEAIKEKVDQYKNIAVNEKMKAVWVMKQDNPKFTWREIGKKMGMHHRTAKNYFEAYEKSIKGEENKDFEQKFIEEADEVLEEPSEDSSAE